MRYLLADFSSLMSRRQEERSRMDDTRIVDLYWSRSQQAIAESKAKYGVCCRGIAYRILQCNEDADECENDTYLRAWNAMPPSRPRFLGAFLARIARIFPLMHIARKTPLKGDRARFRSFFTSSRNAFLALGFCSRPRLTIVFCQRRSTSFLETFQKRRAFSLCNVTG